MPALSQKENLIRLIRFKDPEYIPYGMEATAVFFHRDARFFHGNGNPNVDKWTDAWGVRFEIADKNFRGSSYPVYHPLKSLDDIEDFAFPDPNDPLIYQEINSGISKIDRSSKLVEVNNPGFMFVRSWLLRGMENLLADMILEPERTEILLDRILAYQESIIKNSLVLKPDIVHFGDDTGTTKALMMAPPIWRKMIKPRLKKIIDLCKDAGCLVLMHSCGCIQEIIDDIIEIGVDILNPLQARANDLEYIKEKARGRLTLYGGIDADTVMRGCEEEVAALTEKTMNILAADGGYIASPDQGLPFPKENVEAIKRVVEKKGRLV